MLITHGTAYRTGTGTGPVPVKTRTTDSTVPVLVVGPGPGTTDLRCNVMVRSADARRQP